MLRMMLLGLLIPLGVGVLAAMELRTPARNAVVVVQSPAETTVGISNSHGALAKADRLEIAAASSEAPAQPAPVDERVSPSEGISIGPSEPPRVINSHRHESKSKYNSNQRRSLPRSFLSRSQTQPISSEPSFPSGKRRPATPGPAG